MSENASTKPYLVRALHEWCTDNGYTPHLLVAVNAETSVPMAYVKDGEIVLNLGYSATKNLLIGNEAITFSARFGGMSNNLYIPMAAVRGVFARENGEGMVFPEESVQPKSIADDMVSEGRGADVLQNDKPNDSKNAASVKKPTLTLVK